MFNRTSWISHSAMLQRTSSRFFSADSFTIIWPYNTVQNRTQTNVWNKFWIHRILIWYFKQKMYQTTTSSTFSSASIGQLHIFRHKGKLPSPERLQSAIGRFTFYSRSLPHEHAMLKSSYAALAGTRHLSSESDQVIVCGKMEDDVRKI